MIMSFLSPPRRSSSSDTHHQFTLWQQLCVANLAINRGIYDFDSVIAVRKNDDTGKIEIVDMCGKCRQIFHDYAPGITVLTTNGPQAIEHILPHAYIHQRTKIQRAIK